MSSVRPISPARPSCDDDFTASRSCGATRHGAQRCLIRIGWSTGEAGTASASAQAAPAQPRPTMVRTTPWDTKRRILRHCPRPSQIAAMPRNSDEQRQDTLAGRAAPLRAGAALARKPAAAPACDGACRKDLAGDRAAAGAGVAARASTPWSRPARNAPSSNACRIRNARRRSGVAMRCRSRSSANARPVSSRRRRTRRSDSRRGRCGSPTCAPERRAPVSITL